MKKRSLPSFENSIRLTPPIAEESHRFPDITDLASRLRFAPSDGLIWLDDRRMILLHNASLAALRCELIESVGIERTRGLLTRTGYLSGTKDAEMIRRVRPQSNDFDAFAVGPQLHALEGIVTVETIELEFDVEKGTFHGEFIWRNSCEAEGHIAAYGISNVPVCWMQQGYASGYCSAFAGRQILIREVECRAMGHPCCRIVAKPLEEWEDAEEDVRPLQAQAFVQGTRRRSERASGADEESAIPPDLRGLVGVSAGFNAVCHMIKRAASTKATVLFLGESGVGKERFAQMLHNISNRADKPFVAINCAAIPEQLIESELFGVERGGFSGATQSRPGRFERADGGTLFLDEISALSLIAQGKLLRALQESEIERIGDTCVRKVDVRVVAATNDDLQVLVDTGRFREDLFYRLNVFPVSIPPLRERRADIPLLLDYFLDRYSRLHGRRVTGFSERALDALMAYAWPGNIREIENIVERGVILAPDDGAVDTPHLFVSGERVRGDERMRAGEFKIGSSGALQNAANNGIPPANATEPLDQSRLVDVLRRAINSNLVTFDGMEDLLVQTASDIAHGNISAAAKLLGATRARVAYRLDKIKGDRGIEPSAPGI